MDVEKITQAGGSAYQSVEPVSVSTASKPETADAKAAAVSSNFAPVTSSGKTGQSGEEKQEMDQKEHAASEASIDDAVRSANRKLVHTRCEYSYHKPTKRVSIKVIDEDTNEVIREIPPEKSLDMLQKMWELAGILVDEKR